MAELEYHIDREKLTKILNAIKGLSPRQRGGILIEAMRKAGLFVERHLKGALSGNILKVRTGRLRSSITTLIAQTSEGLQAIIGSGAQGGKRVIYAGIHETGGIITPKRVRWLTIPLPAALTPAGALRRKARDWPNTFFAKNILFQKRGKTIVPLFALKKSVSIPARKYMSKTLIKCKANIDGIILASIKEQLEKAK